MFVNFEAAGRFAGRMMRMRLTVFTEPQLGASYDDLLRVARHAEACGFEAFFRSDHYLTMGDNDGLPGPTDSWATLAGLARETSARCLPAPPSAYQDRSRLQ